MSELFYIVYDGPALARNEMNVRELAPALLAIDDLIKEANFIFNKDRVKTIVNVRASFKTGSFGIELHFIQKILDSILSLFKNEDIISGATLITYIGFIGAGTKGLLQVLKWLKNRKITKIQTKKSQAFIYVEDGEFIETEKEVIKLLENYNIRKSMEQFIAMPLARKGIDTFACCADYKDIKKLFVVKKEEAKYFTCPELVEEKINEQEIETVLKPISISFKEENKWRFTDGQNVFYAKIDDKEFINKIQNNAISFAKDDILKVKLHIKQILTPIDIKTEYTIKKVLNHKRSRKISLPIKDE